MPTARLQFHIPQIFWPTHEPGELLQAAALIGFVILFIAVLLAIAAMREHLERRARLHGLARQSAAAHGLDSDESQLWDRIIVANGEYPSLRGFERITGRCLASGTAPTLVHSLRCKMGYLAPAEGRTMQSTRECGVGMELTAVAVDGSIERTGRIVATDEVTMRVAFDEKAAPRFAAGDRVDACFHAMGGKRFHARLAVVEIGDDHVTLKHADDVEEEELRLFYRAPLEWTLTARRSYDHEAGAVVPEMKLRVKEISATGFSMEGDAGVSEGDVMEVEIPISGRHRPYIAAAHVHRVTHGIAHCSFQGMPLEFEDALHREIMRRVRIATNAKAIQ